MYFINIYILFQVIMLPRCDSFKEVIFTPRIIAFNESFVPVGQKSSKPSFAAIWHDVTSGRSKVDIISAFYAFLLSVRDSNHLTIWLDNCAAQNKNWALYSFFIFIINSEEVNMTTITLKYFEKGHTFMSADSFHHRVESSLGRKGKVYDFQDFYDAVNTSGSKVKVQELKVSDFYEWKDHTSQYKLNKITPRPYLADMVEVRFERGKRTLTYKTDFKGDEMDLNFLLAKDFKMGIQKPMSKLCHKGIQADRKSLLIKSLSGIIPLTRLQFWKDLPLASDSVDVASSSDDSDE